MRIDSLIPENFSDVAVIAYDPLVRPQSFIAATFGTFKSAEQYVSDMKCFAVPYDFVIGDYTYRRKMR